MMYVIIGYNPDDEIKSGNGWVAEIGNQGSNLFFTFEEATEALRIAKEEELERFQADPQAYGADDETQEELMPVFKIFQVTAL